MLAWGALRAKAALRVKEAVANLKNKPGHKSLRLTRRKPKAAGPVAPGRNIIADTLKFVKQNFKFFTGLGLLYAVISYLFFGGVAQDSVLAFRDAATEVFAGKTNSVDAVAALFINTAGGNASVTTNATQQVIGGFLLFVFWLSIIWGARMIMAGSKPTIRDALYNSTTPLVTSFLIFSIVTLQLLPAALGLALYAIAQSGSFVASGVELMMFGFAALLLCLLSLYWTMSSVIATVIVTLPNMRPIQSLKNSGLLVYGRRVRVLGRLLVAIIFVGILWLLVLVPILFLDNWLKQDWLPLIPITTQALGAFSLVFSTVYLYKLYRNLL